MARARSIIVALGLAALLVIGGATADARPDSPLACSPARVQYTRHPRVDRQLGMLPWFQGRPARVGLVGLIWYWPAEWREAKVRTARIFTGGEAPAGSSTKILWAFVAPRAVGGGGRTLVVRGHRLDGAATFEQEFAAISYSGQRGAPSFASIVDVPEPGCWKLELSTGGLRGSVVLLAVG